MSRRKSPDFIQRQEESDLKEVEKRLSENIENLRMEHKRDFSKIMELLEEINQKLKILPAKDDEKIEEEVFLYGLKKSQYDFLEKFGYVKLILLNLLLVI
jgi:hypothetical protein